MITHTHFGEQSPCIDQLNVQALIIPSLMANNAKYDKFNTTETIS